MKTEENNRALEQAKSQLAGLVEMVRAMDRETAIEDWIATLSDSKVEEFCTEAEISFEATERPKLMRELREDLRCAISDETFKPDGFEFDEDAAREAIQEDPLSVEVRTNWHAPGSEDANTPTEFCILLCTGGPAVRIVGALDRYCQPERPRIQYQDWGTPWTEYFPETDEEREALQTYCAQFYFGE